MFQRFVERCTLKEPCTTPRGTPWVTLPPRAPPGGPPKPKREKSLGAREHATTTFYSVQEQEAILLAIYGGNDVRIAVFGLNMI